MQFYVHHDGQQQGPLDLGVVRSRLADGSFLDSDLGWHEGAADWMPLSAIPALGGSHVAPPPMPSGGFPAGQTPVYAGASGPETSGLAIASMVLGFCSFLLGFLTGLPAVICGHVSLSQIKKSGGVIKGRGMAVTGLVIGYLSLLIIPLAILAGIALPVFSAVQERGLAVKSMAQAKQVALGCKRYAGDHGGSFPARLEDLVPQYLSDRNLLVCPLGNGGPESGYEYFGGQDSDPGDKVLLRSQAAMKNHRRVTARVDGSVAMAGD